MSLPELSVIADFFDVLDILENSDIFPASAFFNIGPFLEAVPECFWETSLFLESLTPGTNLL